MEVSKSMVAYTTEEWIAELEAEVKRWRRIAKKRRRKLDALKAACDSLIAAADGLCTTVMLDDQFNELDDEVIEAYDALEGALKAARKVK